MAGMEQRSGYQTKNTRVSAPTLWHPDMGTMESMARISQIVVEKLHLNIGIGRVEFIEDATAGDEVLIRTRDKFLSHTAEVLIHPRYKHKLSGSSVTPEIAGAVAAGVTVTRYLTVKPFASERSQKAITLRGQRVARDVIKFLKKK